MERTLKKKRYESNDAATPDIFTVRNMPPTFPESDDEPEPLEQTSQSASGALADRLFGHGPKVPLSDILHTERRATPQEQNADPVAEDLPIPHVEPVAAQPETQTGPVTQTGPRPATNAVRESTRPESNMVVVSGLYKGYIKAKKVIPVLQGIDMTVGKGEFLSIVGQSGSGKSTLLHLMGTLDVPDKGTIHFEGQRIDNLPTTKRDYLRNRYIGMIFQFYHLIPEMTTLENVLAPLMIRDSFWHYMANRRNYRKKAEHLLELVGLTHRLKHRPTELSGGEMQRASIARALIGEPSILLADEPTGNLDSKTSVEIIKLLRGLNREQNLTIVMVTHDMPQAEEADRIIRLVDGKIVPP